MSETRTTGLVYADLFNFPDDHLRRELIDGELIVTPSPFQRHQWVLVLLFGELFEWTRAHGGRVFPAPMDIVFDDRNVLEPDLLLYRPERVPPLANTHLFVAPDLVVEISSQSTRGTDRVRKKAVFERFGVPEYWIVDLEADKIEVYRLTDGGYGPPVLFGLDDTLTTPLLTGFAVRVASLLPPLET